MNRACCGVSPASLAGFAGLAVSYAVALALTIRESPVVAVAEAVIRITPGPMAEAAIQAVGHWDKPLLVAVILVLLAVIFVVAGLLARRAWALAVLVFLALAGLGTAAVLSRPNASAWDLVPLAVGFATWLVSLNLLTEPLVRAARTPADAEGGQQVRTEARRTFLIRAGVLGVVAVGSGIVGRYLGRGQRHVEQTRRLLRLDGVSAPQVPSASSIGLEGIAPWQTPADDFYLIHTAIAIPAIDPNEWKLRIHGLVDQEIVLTYADLMDREVTEAWTTLNCVSNPVGGTLVGNAWWSGVRLADILAEAGARPERGRGAADLGRRLELRHAPRRADRRPQRDARRRDERQAAAAGARLPGPDDRARPLRLRVGVQVGRRHGGDPLRGHLGVLDPARLGRDGPGQGRVPHRRPRARATRCPPAP